MLLSCYYHTIIEGKGVLFALFSEWEGGATRPPHTGDRRRQAWEHLMRVGVSHERNKQHVRRGRKDTPLPLSKANQSYSASPHLIRASLPPMKSRISTRVVPTCTARVPGFMPPVYRNSQTPLRKGDFAGDAVGFIGSSFSMSSFTSVL